MRARSGSLLVAALALTPGCAPSPAREPPPPVVATAAPVVVAPAAPTAPPPAAPAEATACGALGCRLYATSTEAFRAVLEQKPLVLALGEAHARKDVPGVASSSKRFTAEMLPELKDRASDLVIELMAPPTGCEPSTKIVRKELGKVTAKQADTNQNEYVTMGDEAKKLGVTPHLLHPTCADFKALGAAGADGVDAGLRLIGRLMRESTERLLARNAGAGVEKIVVLYGGAIHNDVEPLEAVKPYSFGPELVAATRGRYVELDVFVPEFISDTGMWTRFAWYPHFDRQAHPEKATLFAPVPSSYTLLLPATKG
jgi:hypothetical protein